MKSMHKLTQNNDKNDAPPPPETKIGTFVPDKANNKPKKPASKEKDSNPNSRRGSTKENKDQNMNRKGSKKANKGSTSAPKYNRADIHDAFFAMMTAYVENHEAVMEEKNRKV